MIFVDTNVFVYAVGRDHPLREPSRAFFLGARAEGRRLVTSAEVLQELLHVYVPVRRVETLDAALLLVEGSVEAVLPLEREDVVLARALIDAHPALGARDLAHVALCRRRGISEVMSHDRGLVAAFGRAG